jgi:hypothetical protein
MTNGLTPSIIQSGPGLSTYAMQDSLGRMEIAECAAPLELRITCSSFNDERFRCHGHDLQWNDHVNSNGEAID